MTKALLTFGYQAKSLLLSLALLLAVSSIFAQASLSVQGVLTKSDGTAVDDGEYAITFKLWTAASGGTAVHSETIANVQTVGGVYNVILGQNGTPLTAPFNGIYYLGVNVGSGSELTPRPQLTHAPYALSLLGQNNTFPSTGTVTADAFNSPGKVTANAFSTPGGAPAGGIANKGYSFGAGGDPDGGLFSYADDHVGLFTNGGERIRATSNLIELKTGFTNTFNLTSYGRVSSNDGFGYHSNGAATSAGMFFANGGTTTSIWANNVPRFDAWNDGNNYYKAPTSHVFQTGNVQVDNNLSINGNVNARSLVRTDNLNGNGGFCFRHDDFQDDDTGVFGIFDGEFGLYSNGSQRLLIAANGDTYLKNTPGFGAANSNVARININSGLIFRETSSRRYKTNIRTLQEDFTKILQVRPCLYNRLEGPSQNDDELGYIAEELDSLGLKRLVVYRADGLPEGVQYDKMAMYAIEIIKTQQATIAQLQAEMAALKGEKEKLATQNTSMQQQQSAFSAQLSTLEKRMKLIESAGAMGGQK